MKIALLIDDYKVPLWTKNMLEHVVSLAVEIPLVIKIPPYRTTTIERNFLAKIKIKISSLLWYFYLRVDKWRNPAPSDIFRVSDISDLFASAEKIIHEPWRTYYCDHISGSIVEKIRGHKIDLIIRLGGRIIKGEILTCTPHGIWSYHHGDNSLYRGGPAAFWECYEYAPVTGAIVQQLNNELDNGLVLGKTFSPTFHHSYNLNKNYLYQQATSLLPNLLQKLIISGDKEFYSRLESITCSPTFYSRKLYRHPTTKVILALLWRIVVRKVKWQFRSLKDRRSFEHWAIAYKFGNGISTEFRSFKHSKLPLSSFIADPFPILVNGDYHLFVEEFSYNRKKGHISHCTITPNGPGPLQCVLKEEHHLSYPFIFEEDDSYFMIPESLDVGRIDLYRAAQFPFQWTYEATLIDNISAVDSTVIKRDGVYWLFTCVRDEGDYANTSKLYLYHSDKLKGPWILHPQSPVVSDVRSARPAGCIVQLGKDLIRPSQDCSKGYGAGLTMNRIVELTRNSYKEVPVECHEPDWNSELCGMHTFNNVEDLTVIDVKFKVDPNDYM
jgi:hypothetical protein